jgi:NO-binding membrane sensor protein with MHYT domain/anti-sigma regulatory factor (Ser/Thr protein kinase)
MPGLEILMTAPSDAVMSFSYDPLQVGLSILIAIAASYAALDLAGRVMAKRNVIRAAWLAGGAVSMGSGIWTMHFVGMLAFHLPVPVFYYWPTVLAALLIAIMASAAALYVVTRKRMGSRYALIGGTVLGSGVAALHYLGMQAMRMNATYTLNPIIVVAAVALGIVFATSGMWLGYYFRDEPLQTAWRRLGATVLMGIAITGMHYTGMASATFRAAALSHFVAAHTVYVSTLGTLGIAAIIMLLLAVTIVSCLVDRRFSAQNLQLTVAQGEVDLANTVRLTLMAELTASISHEIKQPLAAIITNANYSLSQLATAKPDLKEVRQAIQEIVDDGNRTNSIISRVRNLLMKEPPERAPVDVNEVIRDVLQFLRAVADQNRIEIQLQLAGQLNPVHADRVQLQQAFMNVLMNSIEALRSVPERQRKIVIKSEAKSEATVVRIEDSGPGLAPDVSDRLFEPFFTTKPEGMGLGLSISRSIVEAHGGSFSYIPGSEGAIFEFAFPQATGELL